MSNVKVLNAVCPPLNLISCAVCMFFVYIFLHALIGYKKKVRKAPLVVFCVVLAALSILPIFLPEYFDITDIADATSTLCFIVFPYLVLKPYKKKTAFLWIGIAMAASLDYFAFIINYAFKLDTIGQMSAKAILYVLVFIAIMLTSDRVGDFDTIESFDRFPAGRKLDDIRGISRRILQRHCVAQRGLFQRDGKRADYAFVRAHRRMHSVSGYKISYRFAEKARDGEAA